MAEAHYAIIQFRPDPGRLESVNVGLILLCPSLNRQRVGGIHDLRRVTRFFPSADTYHLLDRMQVIVTRLELDWGAGKNLTPGYLRNWGEGLHTDEGPLDAIQMGEVRPCVVTDFDRDFARMFTELVEETMAQTGKDGGQ